MAGKWLDWRHLGHGTIMQCWMGMCHWVECVQTTELYTHTALEKFQSRSMSIAQTTELYHTTGLKKFAKSHWRSVSLGTNHWSIRTTGLESGHSTGSFSSPESFLHSVPPAWGRGWRVVWNIGLKLVWKNSLNPLVQCLNLVPSAWNSIRTVNRKQCLNPGSNHEKSVTWLRWMSRLTALAR